LADNSREPAGLSTSPLRRPEEEKCSLVRTIVHESAVSDEVLV
jgi:hypothetical protein